MTTSADTRARGGGAGLVEGEFLFTDEDFRKIAQILHSHAGIALAEGKAALVYSRLAKRLRSLGLRSFREYCALVEGAKGVDERQAMMAALTTNVTRYFREPHHFDHLREVVMPKLAERARRGGRVRLWSAGSSTGEEVHSLAVTLLGTDAVESRLLTGGDCALLATDINTKVLAVGETGTYAGGGIEAIPAPLRMWTEAAGDQLRFKAEVRRLIRFRQLNLLGAWPFAGSFQVIFCRNVAIYFEEATQQALWARFAERLTPEGRLYIGHSERANHPRLATDGLTTYRLREGVR